MIVLARHGQTEVNRDGLLQGRSDAGLTDLGRRQAERIASALAGGEVGRVLASPLRRTVETAEAIAASCGVELELDDRLLELDYGEWEGRPIRDVAPSEWVAWRSDPSFSPPGGESLLEVERRVVGLCDDLRSQPSDRPRADAVLVSHVSPIKAAVAWALGAGVPVTWRMRLDVAAMCRIVADGPSPMLRSFNETGHLSGLDDPAADFPEV